MCVFVFVFLSVSVCANPCAVRCMDDLHKGLHYCRCASRPECQMRSLISQHARSYDDSCADANGSDADDDDDDDDDADDDDDDDEGEEDGE